MQVLSAAELFVRIRVDTDDRLGGLQSNLDGTRSSTFFAGERKMNRQSFRRVFPRALAWVVVAGLCGVIALGQDAVSTAGQRTDGQIEMDVVHALDASQALKNDLITAATIQSQVTLSGTVSTDASKQLAESIVRGVPGVTGVKNNLNVGNPANDPNAQGAQTADNDDSASQDMANNN